MESGIKLKKHGATNEIAEQSGIYWNNAEARTSTSPLKVSVLPKAQGFRLVTLDPFSSRELGGVWA